MPVKYFSFSLPLFRKAMIMGLSGLLIIFWLIFGLRGVNCLSKLYTVPANCTGNLWIDAVLWGLVLFLIFWDLWDKHYIKEYFTLWKTIWLVILFLLLALLSSAWSLYPPITIVKSLILITATTFAVFIAYHMSINQWIDLLSIFFSIVIIACFLLILFQPSMGIMQNKPYNGAWNGIFWHRNYLGSFMAFASIIFLFNILFRKQKNIYVILLNSFSLVAAMGLVFGSRSGAGILTLILLLVLTLLIFIWTKVHTRLNKWHYVAFGLTALGIIILVSTNLDFIFGLVHRNTSLTGRIPLWGYLFQEYISNRLFLGHGYGAIWTFEQFRTGLQNYLSWGYPVLIGDNGLIDIILHLGIVGVFLVITIILYAFYVTGKYALKEKTGIAFFPLICIIFVVMSNISLSMLVELEFFVWDLLIIAIIKSSDSPSFKISRAEIETQP